MGILIIVSLALLVVSLHCLQGIDTDLPLQTATYQCIKSKGNLFAIIHGTNGAGLVDPNAVQNLYNAAAAGMLTDVKMTPCRGKSAAGQAEEFLKRINTELYNTVWIEAKPNTNPGCNWEGLDP